jgi:hypothetical protein
MTNPPVIGSIVDWLKSGYPAGVPDQDYIPLLSLLARRLTDDEVAAVAAELAAAGEIGVNDIGASIAQLTNEPPRREDVDRVRNHLQTAGPFL